MLYYFGREILKLQKGVIVTSVAPSFFLYIKGDKIKMKRIKLIKTLTSLGALGILGTGTSMLVTSCNGPKHGDRQLSTDITKDSLSATIDYDLWNPNVSNETKTDYIMNVIKSEFPNVITQDLKINNPEI
jgi:hypothetical protein